MLLQEAPTLTRVGAAKLRLFVALDLPEPVRLALDAWRREALTDPALRLVEGLYPKATTNIKLATRLIIPPRESDMMIANPIIAAAKP